MKYREQKKFPLTSLTEMATVGTYSKHRVVTYPSGDPESPGRREHGPPHFIVFFPDKTSSFVVKIPSRKPKTIQDLEVLEGEVGSKDLKKLLNWMLEKYIIDGKESKYLNYVMVIQQWNKENPDMPIKVVQDAAGKFQYRTWKGKRTW